MADIYHALGLNMHQPPGNLHPKAAQVGYKPVHFADRNPPHAARPFPAALYERDRLEPGNLNVVDLDLESLAALLLGASLFVTVSSALALPAMPTGALDEEKKAEDKDD